MKQPTLEQIKAAALGAAARNFLSNLPEDYDFDHLFCDLDRLGNGYPFNYGGHSNMKAVTEYLN